MTGPASRGLRRPREPRPPLLDEDVVEFGDPPTAHRYLRITNATVDSGGNLAPDVFEISRRHTQGTTGNARC